MAASRTNEFTEVYKLLDKSSPIKKLIDKWVERGFTDLSDAEVRLVNRHACWSKRVAQTRGGVVNIFQNDGAEGKAVEQLLIVMTNKNFMLSKGRPPLSFCSFCQHPFSLSNHGPAPAMCGEVCREDARAVKKALAKGTRKVGK